MANKIKYPIISGLKECGNCHNWKPTTQYRKARRHYESYCHDCLKIAAATYRNKPENKERSREYHKNYIKNPEKRRAKNAYLREYQKGEKAKLTKNSWRRKWSAAQKQKAIDYKGGKCEVCGYKQCSAALDFHHRNPLEKNGYGTGALKSHWTFEKNKAEIDKCILVCVRCHREIHAGVTECPSGS